MTPAPTYNTYETSGWSDPTAAWADEPAAAWKSSEADPQPKSYTPSLPNTNETMQKASPDPSPYETDDRYAGATEQEDWSQNAPQEDAEPAPGVEESEAVVPVDGTQMVGKLCRAVYSFQAQNADELEIAEEEQLTIISASDQDWVTAQNAQGMD